MNLSRSSASAARDTQKVSDVSGSPLSANDSVTGVKPSASTRKGSLVRKAMNPSTFFSVSGVGSNCTTVVSKVEVSTPLALQKPSKMDWFVPAWMPMVLPARSATVRIGSPSSRLRMQNGFFWKVEPMIFSGAPCSTM